MAHPQEISVEQRAKNQHLSPLMRAKAKAKTGEKINACPFGCDVRNLDDFGYCRHLIGFTTDGKLYEPMYLVKGRRVVRPKMIVDEEKMGEGGVEEEAVYNKQTGETEYRKVPQAVVMKPVLEEVRQDDKLVRISTSSRVYRDVDGMGAKIEAKKQAEVAEQRARERRLLIEEIKADPEARRQLYDAITADDKATAKVG